MTAPLRNRNRRLGLTMLGVAGLMVGASFAAVPLYKVFCQVTGFNGTPQIGGPAAPGAVAGDRSITVRFSANTAPNLPWRFAPQQASMPLKPGEQGLGFYEAENQAATPVQGIAVYNVTPEVMGAYFHKTACFCFDAQTLQPGQKVDMPVTFWVDPAMMDDPNTRDIRSVTLSYTFFRTLEDAQKAGVLASAGPHVGRATATP